MRAWWRGRALVARAALFVGLLLLDALLYQVTLPVAITSDGAALTVTVGGETHREPISGRIVGVSVPARDPVVHEFQIDGSDSTNNFTLDPAYLHSIATTPYYQLYAWMRDLDGLSRWRNLCLASAAGAAPQCSARPPLSGVSVSARVGATGASQRVSAQVQRPETPVELDLAMSDGSLVSVTINRNDRFVELARTVGGEPTLTVAKWYFPTDTAPFAAMTLDFLARVALWALALLGLVWGGEWLLGYALAALGLRLSGRARAEPSRAEEAAGAMVATDRWGRLRAWLAARWRTLTAAIHPVGLVGLALSFGYVVWIALAQYQALPHIYDAAAYLFGAKTFAAGRLWAPAPPASVAANFPGPFMVTLAGKWFNQYAPGTSLTLALGVTLNVPWLVEPLMGTLALLGVGLIAYRLYGDRRVATLAVLLRRRLALLQLSRRQLPQPHHRALLSGLGLVGAAALAGVDADTATRQSALAGAGGGALAAGVLHPRDQPDLHRGGGWRNPLAGLASWLAGAVAGRLAAPAAARCRAAPAPSC